MPPRRSTNRPRAQVQQAQAALSQAQTNLRYTKIISPIDGIVVDRQYDVGQTVAASFQAPTLFQIAQDLTKMQVQADVDQSDIGRVQVGQIARFTVDAYPEDEFRGRISQIRYNAPGQPERRHLPGDHRSRESRGTAAAEDDRERHHRRRHGAERAARAERRAALQAADGRRRRTQAAGGGDAMQRAARSGRAAADPPARRGQLPAGRRRDGVEDADRLHARRGEEAEAGRDPHRHQRRPLHAGRFRSR